MRKIKLKKEHWLYILLGVTFIGYVLFDYYKPKPFVWQTTYLPKDKNPFGGFILKERIEDICDTVDYNFLTLYEIAHEDMQFDNVLVITDNFRLDETDQKVIFDWLDSGKNVLIVSKMFMGDLLDTLELSNEYQWTNELSQDSATIKFENGSLGEVNELMTSSYFEEVDSTWSIHAKTNEDQPILMSKTIAKGNLILCSSPIAFTNYGLLSDYQLAEIALQKISSGKTLLSLYYHLGKPQNPSMFRFFVSEPALRWITYLGLVGLILFLVINSQRKQRETPIIAPPENSTVAFIEVMGALFFAERKHKKTAMKLINHQLNVWQEKFLVKPSMDENYYRFITNKLSCDKTDVVKFFEMIQRLQKSAHISEEQLKSIYYQLERLKNKTL